MDQHDGNQMGVMRLLARNEIRAGKPFPCACHSGFALQQTKKTIQYPQLACDRQGLIPSPLLATGRVATTQNSTRFCGAMQRSTLCCRDSATAFAAVEYWEC